MHRVQRIPPTEKSGRVHTSTVAVAIIGALEDVSVEIKANDLAYRWHSGTGAGGQHRNKTQNCLALTHVPTGTTVSASGRSRKENERQAMELLRRQVCGKHVAQGRREQDDARRLQAGDRSRSGERVRTWKLQTGQVIDHRGGKTARMRDIEKKGVAIIWPDR